MEGPAGSAYGFETVLPYNDIEVLEKIKLELTYLPEEERQYIGQLSFCWPLPTIVPLAEIPMVRYIFNKRRSSV